MQELIKERYFMKKTTVNEIIKALGSALGNKQV
jgi:hypothetical protein